MKRELNASLRKDREVRWPHRAAETEYASAKENSRKMFHFIRATSRKVLGVSGMIREADGLPIHSQ